MYLTIKKALKKMKHLFKSFIRMFIILFSIGMGFFLILLCILLIYSPGKIEPYLDNVGKPIPTSVSEKTFLKIGGVKQGMFIRSKNINHPILLYMHGGPTFLNYFLIDKFKPDLEEYFTVCYWEQRGGGLSYMPEVTVESMNFNQFSSDAIEVTNYLRKRFNKEKIYIMAHSGGTPIALLAVQKEPHLFYAYLGIGQITNQA